MHKILIAFLKIQAFLLSLLPRKIFLFKARALGFLLYFFGFRKNIIEENISRAYPEWADNQRRAFLKKNYQHYGIVFLEILRSFYHFERYILKYSEVEGAENVQEAIAQGKGVLALTAHMGNWEVMAASAMIFLKIPTTMVTKQLKPKWLHDFVEKERASMKIKMAFEPKTLSRVMRALKNKELVGFVMDQYTGAPVGARVPFFGVPVGSQTALAALAIRTKAVVVPAFAYRKADGTYGLRFEKAIPTIENDNLEDAIILNTAKYVEITERWVREFPDQWLWIHRRWKGDLSPLAPNSVGEMLR